MPTTSLDLLRQLKREFGKTIIMVTHDPLAEAYVDQVFHLDKGVLVNSTTPHESQTGMRGAVEEARG